ncbi:hypothetical protein ABK046_47105, partial [Streptomyces caeruleatus]
RAAMKPVAQMTTNRPGTAAAAEELGGFKESRGPGAWRAAKAKHGRSPPATENRPRRRHDGVAAARQR